MNRNPTHTAKDYPMTAQKGRDLLLKVFNTTTSAYVTVAGLRSRKLAFNASQVDVTDAESAGRWRELLAGAGVNRAPRSRAPAFSRTASDELVRSAFFSGAILNWQVVIPDYGGRGRSVPDRRTRIFRPV